MFSFFSFWCGALALVFALNELSKGWYSSSLFAQERNEQQLLYGAQPFYICARGAAANVLARIHMRANLCICGSSFNTLNYIVSSKLDNEHVCIEPHTHTRAISQQHVQFIIAASKRIMCFDARARDRVAPASPI